MHSAQLAKVLAQDKHAPALSLYPLAHCRHTAFAVLPAGQLATVVQFARETAQEMQLPDDAKYPLWQDVHWVADRHARHPTMAASHAAHELVF